MKVQLRPLYGRQKLPERGVDVINPNLRTEGVKIGSETRAFILAKAG
jgi:hypothetical protein